MLEHSLASGREREAIGVGGGKSVSGGSALVVVGDGHGLERQECDSGEGGGGGGACGRGPCVWGEWARGNRRVSSRAQSDIGQFLSRGFHASQLPVCSLPACPGRVAVRGV
jgi:hypothetical protein